MRTEREERRRKQKEFINISAGTAVLMLGIIVLVHLQVAGMISNQDSRNQYMGKQIEIVDKQIAEINSLEKEKAALLARMKVIQELQGTRPVIVHIFDEIAKNLPEQAFLIGMKRVGNNINLEGVAENLETETNKIKERVGGCQDRLHSIIASLE